MKSFDVAAVVSGGASGLGEATTRALAAEGAAVTILDLNEDRGQALAKELGGHTTFVRTDVTDEASVQAAIADAAGKDRPLRIAVNCAGIGWAQLTAMRSGRSLPVASAIASCTDASSVTSVRTNVVCPPSSVARACPRSSLRSRIVTAAPLAASARVVASPSPEAPPVTTAATSKLFMARRLASRSSCTGGRAVPRRRRAAA